jgi:MFS family permease
MRAVAVAVVVLCTGLLGQVLGPLLVGILNDALAPIHGEAAIRYSLLVVAACMVLGAGCFFIASTRSAAATAAAE